MNVLFLTLVEINSVEERGIYQDLLRKFRDEGHSVTIVTPVERRRSIKTNLTVKEGITLLQVQTLNIQKTNIVEKGIGTLALEYQYLRAVKKYLIKEKFDLVLYSTPPITLVKVVEYIKKRDGAFAYLLLKDIFPQNAVDMKMIAENGLIHRQFQKKERKLYEVSDAIGTMSPANAGFVARHHPYLDASKIEVNPNSIVPLYLGYTEDEKKRIREKYELPTEKRILVYGGNLGRPQGLDFLLETITAVSFEQAFFLIVGEGTEYNRIQQWMEDNKPVNAKLLRKLPKEDYDMLLSSCDIGLIFLERNFTIPNFPSRLLSYLEMQMPVIAATDPNTDIGDIIEKHGCGYKVPSGDRDRMVTVVDLLMDVDLAQYRQPCKNLLESEYHTRRSYDIIMKWFHKK
ncbi:glycosyltransferase family 4 protein [Chryseobacterium lacus]|uniref:glycosyltransferase family 4 protein n=1 Tax=Chryseobacterium lacus TaxID=2058346 RepID=UPI000F885F14|nr:glycosyltransferase family 4 protein [Chryseobacterium lacus]RST26679.1 glycosyltransferase WbuB [Chryseobacterium lacus]